MKKLFTIIFLILLTTFIYSQNEFTLNFDGVDIKTFIKLVSEFTHKNYVLHPNVRGTITVYSQKPIPAKDIDKIFSTILSVYGYTVIEKDGIYEIAPISEAKVKSRDVNIGKIPPEKMEVFINQIVPLKYYPASTISQILSPYITKGGQITVDERTNCIIISDIGANISKLMKIIEKIDTPTPPGKEMFKVFKLENASAPEISKVLNQVLSRRTTTRVIRRGRYYVRTPAVRPIVVADKATNSIIAYAEPEDLKAIENLIKQLDVMSNQVLIEALIAEVTYEKTKEMGIEWVTSDDIKNGKYKAIIGSNFEILQNFATTGLYPSGLTIATYKGELTIPLSVGAIINLYGKDTHFNILSTPQIMTADNQEATINISENIPYIKETRFISGTQGTPGGDIIKSYGYKDVGIILKITPQISQDKYVKLKIKQEVTKLVEGGIPEAPTTAKRSAETTLIVPNNQTIVLGGLMRNDTETTVHKVPFFGDIPLIGKLFQKESKKNIKTNLLIFITPHIITSFEEAEKIREEKEEILKDIKNEE